MAAPTLNTLWNWFRARAGEWTTTGVLPPPTEKLRWPHKIKLYLICVPIMYGLVVLLLFFTAPILLFGFSPPTASPVALYHALIRCVGLLFSLVSWGSINDLWADIGYFTFPALPLWVIEPLWNRRAVRLAQKQAALAASTDTIWPPPPQRPI